MALAHSFYAEQAAVRGDLDEARRRRLVVARLLRRVARGALRRGGAFVLAGEAGHPRRRPRSGREPLPSGDRGLRAARPAGHELDVPRHGGRLRRAGRRLPGRDQDARSGDRDQRVAARRVHRVAAGPPRLGAAPRRPAGPGRGGLPARARLGPPGAPHHGDLPGPGRVGRAAPAPRRDDAAVEAATEALELHRADDFRRFRNRIDPKTDLQAARRGVLRGARRDRRRTGRTGTRRDAARAGRPPAGRVGRRGAGVPARRRDPGQSGRGAALAR